MDTDLNFMSFDTLPSVASVKEQEFEDSDHEQSSSIPQDDSDFTSTDYWFGKIYFKCVLAQEVFSRATARCSSMRLESLLDARLREFPYKSALRKCREQALDQSGADSWFPTEDHHSELLVVVGRVLRKDSKAKKQRLLTVLRNPFAAQNHKQPPPEQADVLMAKGVPGWGFPPGQSSVSSNDGDSLLPRYTSVLKEKGDIDGFIPMYNFRAVSQIPSVFRAVVSFQDYTFEGEGRTKQLAKHEASKEACQMLGLEVT